MVSEALASCTSGRTPIEWRYRRYPCNRFEEHMLRQNSIRTKLFGVNVSERTAPARYGMGFAERELIAR